MTHSVRSGPDGSYRCRISLQPRLQSGLRCDATTEDPGHQADLERRLFAALIGVVAAPFVVAAIGLLTREWIPAGDQALQILKLDQVGTSRTPLLGAWSRWGWNHPGPWPVYVLAPFTWVFGTVGALIGTLMINAASLVLAVAAGRRRGGLAAAGLVALAGLLMGFAQGPTVLMDLWNPFVGLFPLYALVVIAWSISDRDWVLLPVMVALASFSVQAHIGYLPVVAGICLAGLALSLRPLRAAPDDGATLDGSHSGWRRSGWRRPLLVSAVVFAVAWLPTLIEELGSGRGNITRLTRYAIDSPEPSLGWRYAWRVFATELGLPGAWVTGAEFDPFGSPDSPAGAILVVLVVAVLGTLAYRAGAASAARLAGLTLIAAAAAIVATSRITGLPYDYLLVWWWAVGAGVWLSIAWSAGILLARAAPASARTMIGLVLVAVAVVALGSAVRSIGADLPVSQQSAAVEALVEQVEPRLREDASYIVEWRDNRGFGYVGVGVLVELSRRGFDVVVPTDAGVAFDDDQRGDVADHRLVISTRDDDVEFPPPPGSAPIARYDPLSAADRATADTLWSAIAERAGAVAVRTSMVDSPVGRDALIAAGVDPTVLDRFLELWNHGPAFVAYLAPGSTDGR